MIAALFWYCKVFTIEKNRIIDDEKENMLQTSLLITQTVSTLEEYLTFEETADAKHEYHNGKLHRIPGGTFNHNRIGLNVAFLLNLFFDQKKIEIEAFSSDMKIYSEALERAFYPDVSVVIGDPQQVNSNSKSIFTNPVLLVDVLSKSTRNYDMTTKFGHYRSIPSFSEYVIIEQDRFFVEVRTLVDKERGLWDIQQYENAEDEVYLQSVECKIKLSEMYKRVEFEEEL